MTRSILFLALTLTALPATADDTIRAGTDIWETQGDGRTYTDLNLPARLGDTTFNASGVAIVNAIVWAISFKSTASITISGCPGSAYWDVRSVATSTQTPFSITIRRSSPTATGGTFDSSVTVTPKLIFTQQGSGLQRSLDQQPVTFTTHGLLQHLLRL